jgi:DNA polymerase III delta subunit
VGQDLPAGWGDRRSGLGRRHGPLGAEDVAAVMGRGMAQPVYRLGDAFGARQAAKSLELLASLLDDGEAGPRLLATLHRALRQVRGAKALQQRRASREEIITLGLFPR